MCDFPAHHLHHCRAARCDKGCIGTHWRASTVTVALLSPSHDFYKGYNFIWLHSGHSFLVLTLAGSKSSPVSACCRSTFCTRKRYALYQGRNTLRITLKTPSFLKARLSPRTTGELIRYSLSASAPYSSNMTVGSCAPSWPGYQLAARSQALPPNIHLAKATMVAARLQGSSIALA